MFPEPGKAVRHKDFLKVCFIGYLYTRVTSTVSSAVSSASETSTTRRKRSAGDSPLASSTPRSHPPIQKRPAVVCADSDARIVPTARRFLVFIDLAT